MEGLYERCLSRSVSIPSFKLSCIRIAFPFTQFWVFVLSGYLEMIP